MQVLRVKYLTFIQPVANFSDGQKVKSDKHPHTTVDIYGGEKGIWNFTLTRTNKQGQGNTVSTIN